MNAQYQPLSNLAVRDIETVVHPFTNQAKHREMGPDVLERGEGIYVWDVNGHKLIEGMAGLWCTALGYGNEELIETAAEQMRRLSFSHIFTGKSHDPAIELAEKLKEIAPGNMSKVLFCSSGSEANDAQVRLQWYYNNAHGRPEKKKIISRIKGYHGITLMAASLTGLPACHKEFDLPFDQVKHARAPHHYREAHPGETEEDFATRLADELEQMILDEGPDTVAAFIAEPILASGGVIVPPKTYYQKVQAVLKKYEVMFIADEVICGFGRLGTMFGCEEMGITPDSMSIAKALTSAYVPLGATLINEPLYEALVAQSEKIGTFGHGHTYAGHPVAAAVGVKAIEIYERDNIPARAAEMGVILQKRLKQLEDHPLVGEARGAGMIGAVELVADKETKREFLPTQGVGDACARFLYEEGVILRNRGDAVCVSPPLIIKEDELNDLFDRWERALDKTEAWVTKEGLRAA